MRKKQTKIKTESYSSLLDEFSTATIKPKAIDGRNHSLTGWQSVRCAQLEKVRVILNKIQTRHESIYGDVSFFQGIFDDLDGLEKNIIESFSLEKDINVAGYYTYFDEKVKNQIELSYNKMNSFISRTLVLINAHRNSNVEPIDFKQTENRKIFVVHGHNHKPLSSIRSILKKEEIESIVLIDEVASGSDFILNKFLSSAGEAKAAIIVATGDVFDSIDGQTYPRPNVLLELGFFIGMLSLDRIIVLVDNDSVIPSDIKGIDFLNIKMKNWTNLLLQKLYKMGF